MESLMNLPDREKLYFGLTKRDFCFAIVVLGIILIATLVLALDQQRRPFHISSIQDNFLPTFSLAVVSGLVLAASYAYFLFKNTHFLFMSFCWLAHLIYIVCGMVGVNDKQKYFTFIVALTADLPLFLSGFSGKERRWWYPAIPILIFFGSITFYSVPTQLTANTKLSILYLCGPLFSAAILLWVAYALASRNALDSSIEHIHVYSFTFLTIALMQLPFSYQSLCYFAPGLYGCSRANTFLSIGRTVILAAKIGNLVVIGFMVKDKLIGLRSALKIKGEFEELGYFAATLEHELRNPLVILGDEIEFLVKHAQTNEELQKRFITLERQLNRISGAADIINVMRSKREDILKKMRPISLIGIINQAIKDVKKEFPNETSNVFFEVVDRTNQASIEAVYTQIEQCLVNIFKNSIEAIKRVGKTGEIVVETSFRDQNTVAISIRDNGDGFVLDDLPMLTDPGYTKKQKSTTKSNRGLGLFVCNRIVELHEGKVSFSNHSKGGALVVMEFARYVSKKKQKATNS
jgi:signal transduction histidine kinase